MNINDSVQWYAACQWQFKLFLGVWRSPYLGVIEVAVGGQKHFGDLFDTAQ